MESTLGMTDLSHTRSHLEDLTIVQWFPNDRNIQNTWSGGSSPPSPARLSYCLADSEGFESKARHTLAF